MRMYRWYKSTVGSLVVFMLFMLWPFVTTVVYLSRLPQPGEPLVQGHIINMEVQKTIIQHYSKFNREPLYSDNSYTTYLTIKIVNTDTIVKTFVQEDWTGKAPEVVSFYYSGDPSKMVFLQEDTLPLRNMLSAWELVGFFLLVIIVIFMMILFIFNMLYKRAATIRANEFQAYPRNDDYSEYTSDDEFSQSARQEEFETFLKKLDKS